MNCLAILVNYHCRKLIAQAVASLSIDTECDWIHVVDNSESTIEAAWLKQHLPAHVKLIVSPQNIGFGCACNLALEGMKPDSVLLLNPDAHLLAGGLRQLKKTLFEFNDVAAVSPRIFWDDEQQFLLPPSTYPSRFDFFLDLLGQRWHWISELKAKQFRQNSLLYWTTNQPVQAAALSGGHVLLRYQALISAKGLFDPRFFMYWEDTDLMRRLNDRGWQLMMEPRALAVHSYEHSISKDKMMEQSWPTFKDKYFSHWFWRRLMKYVQASAPSKKATKFSVLQPSGSQGFVINVPAALQTSWLLEVSPSMNFVPSIGHIGVGPRAILPILLAKRFKDRDYYLRIGPVIGAVSDSVFFVFNSNPSVN
jgi:GT2 family glycosyltransferase